MSDQVQKGVSYGMGSGIALLSATSLATIAVNPLAGSFAPTLTQISIALTSIPSLCSTIIFGGVIGGVVSGCLETKKNTYEKISFANEKEIVFVNSLEYNEEEEDSASELDL